MHYAFDIHNEQLRAEVIKILLDDNVGDIDKQNHQGLEPVLIYHKQPVPREFFNRGDLNFKKHFKG